MGKTIDLSLRAIKVAVEPYIGQTCNLKFWVLDFGFGLQRFFWAFLKFFEVFDAFKKSSCM